MSEDKKTPRKKSDEEKKQEKDAMINLWMNNLGGESSADQGKKENAETEDKE